jgi:hypothetical protein
MQRKAKKPRPKLDRQVTIRLAEDLYQKLQDRADAINRATPGLSVTVSDVIRSMLISLTRGPTAAPPRSPKRPKTAAADTPAPTPDESRDT